MMVVAGVGMLALGCTGTKRTLVPVTGSVTYNGQPVEGALVTFSPVTGVTAFDTTDAEGKFSLVTQQGGEGCEPGLYTVTVRKTEEAAAAAGPVAPSEDPAALGNLARPTGERPESVTPESLIPEVYGHPTTTPLRDYEVKAEGTNDFPIVLDDNAQPFAPLPTTEPVDDFRPEGTP